MRTLVKKDRLKGNESLRGGRQRRSKQRRHFKNLSSQTLSSLSDIQITDVASVEDKLCETVMKFTSILMFEAVVKQISGQPLVHILKDN